MTCPARKRFSPSSSKNASSLAWVRPSRFTFAASVIAIHHSSGVCGRASGAGAQLGFGEEVADFTGSRSGGVGTVDGVGVDGLGEVGTDGTGSSFLGVGGAHQLAFFSTAPSPSRTWTTTGPEVMKLTRSLKKGRSLCSA